MFCSECGTRLRDDERFCHACGAPVSVAAHQGEASPHVDAAPELPSAASERTVAPHRSPSGPANAPQGQPNGSQSVPASSKRRPLRAVALVLVAVIVLAVGCVLLRAYLEDAAPAGPETPTSSAHSAAAPAADKGSWTVLAYICGYNLESQVSSFVDHEGRYVVQVDGNTEWLAGATFMVGQLLDDGTLVWLGSDNDLDLYINEETGAVQFVDRFDGGWYKIGDCHVYADIVDAVAVEGKPSYNLHSTPVEWTTTVEGETYTLKTNLLSYYDYDTGGHAVICVYEDAGQGGMAGKSVAALSEGDKLRFLVEREVDGVRQTGSTGTLAVTRDLALGRAFAGNYGAEHTVSAQTDRAWIDQAGTVIGAESWVDPGPDCTEMSRL